MELKEIIKRLYYSYIVFKSTKSTVRLNDIEFPIYLNEGKFKDKIDNKGIHEPGLTEMLYRSLSCDDVFWDIGHAQGYYTILASNKIVDSSNIYAFDPNKLFKKLLNKNINQLKINANIVDKAMLNMNSTISVTGNRYVIESMKCPTVIKIDVEGNEIEVLKGMDWVLGTLKPLIFIEVHPKIRLETHDFVFKFLNELGYDIKQIVDFRKKNYKLKTIKKIEDIIKTENYMLMAM